MPNEKTVLIVDDDAAIRGPLQNSLEVEGLVVYEADNGEKGLSLALAKHPDVVLLDIDMPKMGGVAMLKALHQDSWGKHIPVLMLTNLNDRSMVAEVLESGSYDYLVKSDWPMHKVVELVKKRLQLQKDK